ncbi:glycosyl hydrolase [Plantactinospora sp. KBS50]|uniref:glycosyl hydrolase n=1 Tax=Plantactinospora sp. KBS50 TaxID=2024580 RepID=UPI001E5EDCFA|nr:glycosyl hydrolase [Plantactinospora sp. KBS50]
MKPSARPLPRVLVASTSLLLLTGVVFAVVSGTRPAEAATVGAGSYTTTPVGPLPNGCGSISTSPRQFATADAPPGAVPTNDWWSSLLFKRTDCAYSEPLHAHPLSYDTFGDGLGFSANSTPSISGTATGVGEYHYPYVEDIRVGVAGLAAPVVKAADWTDWTVTPYWSDGSRTLRATIGHGLPFAYFQATGGNARITVTGSPTVWANDGPTIGFSVHGHDYVGYAPSGASWTVSGGTFSSTLNGRGYFSVALLPTTSGTPAADRAALAGTYGRYAHAHVTGTRVSYAYDPATSRVTTTYAFTVTAREGTATQTVVSLYPHQWKALTGATPIAQSYPSARGTMKVLTGVSQFRTAMAFHGVLPELPAVGDGAGTDRTTLGSLLAAERANPMDQRGGDTYWTGKGLGRAARLAEIADLVGETAVRDSALDAIRGSLTNWFTASGGETGQLFYYDQNWGTLIGYPASYGSDQELNDHHFHYGYFVAAAATLAKFDPAWAATDRYGGMVDLLIRDADNYDRTDSRFPYLRDFDIYAGHDWASGHGSFASGNNQESSSEGMNFANALIQWGQVTGNREVRDAGVFLYATQAAAIREYWFDVDDENFPSAFEHSCVGMVWGTAARTPPGSAPNRR